MKERPILFKGAMVRAILEGRKTQTRRVVKGESKNTKGRIAEVAYDICGPSSDDPASFGFLTAGDHGYEIVRCPYGQPGDRLWVRETWSMNAGGTDDGPDGSNWHIGYRAGLSVGPARASDSVCLRLYDTQRCDWRPSIHMPRWASRISLEITGIRAERMQTISLDDAKAEGVETTDKFTALWTDTYGAKSWNSDPWVWVVEFRQARKEATP